MKRDTILIGKGREIIAIPREEWEQELSAVPQRFKAKLSFMTAAHHRVRYFVVRELPITRKPLSIEVIAKKTQLSVGQVLQILDDLEQNLTYLYRNPQGMVSWAYPVTVEKTPHAITFSTGESLFAA